MKNLPQCLVWERMEYEKVCQDINQYSENLLAREALLGLVHNDFHEWADGNSHYDAVKDAIEAGLTLTYPVRKKHFLTGKEKEKDVWKYYTKYILKKAERDQMTPQKIAQYLKKLEELEEELRHGVQDGTWLQFHVYVVNFEKHLAERCDAQSQVFRSRSSVHG